MNTVCSECNEEESQWLWQCTPKPTYVGPNCLSAHMTKLSQMTHLLQPISVYQEAISYQKAEKENKKIHAKEKIKERCRQVAEELESDV